MGDFFMKKIVLSLIILIFMNVSNGFTAPFNTIDQGQMSIGIVGGDITKCYYFENKISNNLTVGIQSINSDLDFYGIIDLYPGFNSGNTPEAGNTQETGNTPKLIIGSRDLGNGATTYGGVGLAVPLAEGLDGYTSLIAGAKFQEFQLGSTCKISDSVSLNFNYRIVRHNGTKNGVGIGLNCRI
jgi:hypothetical protein